MSAFDKIVGYEPIKKELLQICDMIHSPDVYTRLGAKLPHGLILRGAPGLGKTLMAKCFIEETGLPSFTLRRQKSDSDFIEEIGSVFRKAVEDSPSIVFLDDMDKFANEDEKHSDADEYVAIQAGIDEVKDKNVFVIATVNQIRKLPDSLIRPGRFDRNIRISNPVMEDAEKIIRYYLSSKKVSEKVCFSDLSRMISDSSCAQLETILNEAAVTAAYARKGCVEMEDLIDAVLKTEYDSPANFRKVSEEEKYKTALHEAGHVVVCETLVPESIGLASIRPGNHDGSGGFVHRFADIDRPDYDALVSLGGKAAVELYYAETKAAGCYHDMQRAVDNIRGSVACDASKGFGFLDTETNHSTQMSESLNRRTEIVVQAELETCLLKARDILIQHRPFLETLTKELCSRNVLLFSDIQKIKKICESKTSD